MLGACRVVGFCVCCTWCMSREGAFFPCWCVCVCVCVVGAFSSGCFGLAQFACWRLIVSRCVCGVTFEASAVRAIFWLCVVCCFLWVLGLMGLHDFCRSLGRVACLLACCWIWLAGGFFIHFLFVCWLTRSTGGHMCGAGGPCASVGHVGCEEVAKVD